MRNHKKLIFLFVAVPVVIPMLFMSGKNVSGGELDDLDLEIEVESKANSGGNHSGSGSIRTGSARSRSSISNEINREGDNKIKIDAEAEANGKKEEINLEVNPDDLINGSGFQEEIRVESGENEGVQEEEFFGENEENRDRENTRETAQDDSWKLSEFLEGALDKMIFWN